MQAQELPVLDAFGQYRTNVVRAKADRVSDNRSGETVLSETTVTEENADSIKEFQRTVKKKTSDFSKLVMMDNTIGAVFPGALFWAAAVRDGQLHQLEQVPGLPPVTVTFAGMKELPPSLPAEFLVSTTESNERKVSFVHNGTYADFEEKGRPILVRNQPSGVRLDATVTVRQSLKDALLSIGLSAEYWTVRMSAGMQSIREESRTVALLTLDQVTYSVTADAPPLGGYLPDAVVQANAMLATRLAAGTVTGGEPAYVRKVDYGRRVLVALSAESGKEEFTEALSIAVDAVKGNFQGDFSNEQKAKWKSVEAKIVLIGGSYPDGIGALFTGDLKSFVRTVQAIMKKENVESNSSAGAVPISFELAYVDDNAPMQVYETIEFASKIRTCQFGKVLKTAQIVTTGQDAAVTREDDEIDTDDWTLVQLTSQRLRLSADRRTVFFDVAWQACEANDDKKLDGHTVIASSKTFSYPFNKPIKAFISPTSIGNRDQWYAGKSIFDPQAFPNHGLLSNIRVRFDADGKRDHTAQLLRAELNFSVWLEQ